VLALLKAEVRHHRVQVRLQLAADLAEVQGDRVLLEQVLLNLILNSLQAMDGLPRARRLIEISTANQPGGIRVSIRDHGPGMDAQAAQRVFEPFFTTRAEGLGLGLNICRTIIESHGGRLGFEQAADEGITFFFDLPRGL
jgi:C4-dicarboxylate-specific signal transduction histidine kinase